MDLHPLLFLKQNVLFLAFVRTHKMEMAIWSRREVTFNDLYIRAVMAIPFGLKSLIMPFGLTYAPVRFQQPMAKDPILVLW